MSLLFYRRPDYLGRDRPQLTETKCASFLEQAEASKSQIPDKLSFEEIVKNNTLPPCSLNDFMDYLMYIEYNAECLQFFLWYCDYVERWTKLPREERALSPMWSSSTSATSPKHKKHTRSRSFTEKTDRLKRILTILEKSPSQKSEAEGRKSRRNDSNSSNSTNFSWPRSSLGDRTSSRSSSRSSSSAVAAPTTQPFRDEMTRVVQHYISDNGPRQLNLTHQDRLTCIDAASHTTHPSALLPAFAAAEALLRGQCHPNFVRWSISNSNRPRVVFVRGLATLLILLGFALDVLLVLSRSNQFIRLAAIPLWCTGFMLLIASKYGLCVILHWNFKRNLRPWEQFADEEIGRRSHKQEAAGDNDGSDGEGDAEGSNDGKDEEKKSRRGHKRQDTGLSANSRSDPLRKQSLQSLGSPNTFDAEPWVDMYAEKPVWKRVFELSVATQNRHLRAVQDRIVFKAFFWGLLLATTLGVGSIFIPSPGLF